MRRLDDRPIYRRKLRYAIIRRRTITAALQNVCTLEEVQISCEVARCHGTRAERDASAQA